MQSARLGKATLRGHHLPPRCFCGKKPPFGLNHFLAKEYQTRNGCEGFGAVNSQKKSSAVSTLRRTTVTLHLALQFASPFLSTELKSNSYVNRVCCRRGWAMSNLTSQKWNLRVNLISAKRGWTMFNLASQKSNLRALPWNEIRAWIDFAAGEVGQCPTSLPWNEIQA